MLPDGRRLHLNDGPIDVVIGADGPALEVQRAFDVATARFNSILDELCRELPLLRQPTGRVPQGSIARRMWRATLDHAAHSFITPMAAVAGAVAEELLYSIITVAQIERAHVNNGGDIAIHLTPWTEYHIGVVDRPDHPSIITEATIRWTDPVRGIATSGWRGRSFSLGIADAVTVLAAEAAIADAAATLIANAVDLPGHAAVTRLPANSIQPDSDLGPRLVTRAVGPLTASDIAQALERGVAVAQAMLARRQIIACALHLAGETRLVGEVPVAVDRRLPHNG